MAVVLVETATVAQPIDAPQVRVAIVVRVNPHAVVGDERVVEEGTAFNSRHFDESATGGLPIYARFLAGVGPGRIVNVDIEQAVLVNVHEGAVEGEIPILSPRLADQGGEPSVAVVAEEIVQWSSPTLIAGGQVNILIAVAVEVAYGATQASPEREGDRVGRDLLEGSIPLIAVEGLNTASGTRGRTQVHEEIQESVVIIVPPCRSVAMFQVCHHRALGDLHEREDRR